MALARNVLIPGKTIRLASCRHHLIVIENQGEKNEKKEEVIDTSGMGLLTGLFAIDSTQIMSIHSQEKDTVAVLWSLDKKTFIAKYPFTGAEITAAATTEDRIVLATYHPDQDIAGSAQKTNISLITLIDSKTHARINTLGPEILNQPITVLVVAPQRQWVIAFLNKLMVIIDTTKKTHSPYHVYHAPFDVTHATLSPRQDYLALASEDKVHVYTMQSLFSANFDSKPIWQLWKSHKSLPDPISTFACTSKTTAIGFDNIDNVLYISYPTGEIIEFNILNGENSTVGTFKDFIIKFSPATDSKMSRLIGLTASGKIIKINFVENDQELTEAKQEEKSTGGTVLLPSSKGRIVDYSESTIKVSKVDAGSKKLTLLKKIDLNQPITVLFSLDENHFLTQDKKDGIIRVWEIKEEKESAEFNVIFSQPNSGTVTAAAFMKNRIAIATHHTHVGAEQHETDRLTLWQYHPEKQEWGDFSLNTSFFNSPVFKVLFMPGVEKLVALSGKEVGLWNLQQLTPKGFYSSFNQDVTAAALSISQRWLAVGFASGYVYIYDTKNINLELEERSYVFTAGAPILCLTFTPKEDIYITTQTMEYTVTFNTDSENKWSHKKALAPIISALFMQDSNGLSAIYLANDLKIFTGKISESSIISDSSHGLFTLSGSDVALKEVPKPAAAAAQQAPADKELPRKGSK